MLKLMGQKNIYNFALKKSVYPILCICLEHSVSQNTISGYDLISGIHPTSISEAFQKAAVKSMEILEKMSRPLELSDRESLLKSASTSLNSKVGCSLSLIKLKAYGRVNTKLIQKLMILSREKHGN